MHLLPMLSEHPPPFTGELLVLWHDVLDRVFAGVRHFLAAVILQPIEQIEADPLSVNVLLFEGLLKLRIVGESVSFLQSREANRERFKSKLPIDGVCEVREYLPVTTCLCAADRATNYIALNECYGLCELVARQCLVRVKALKEAHDKRRRYVHQATNTAHMSPPRLHTVTS